MKLLLHTCCGPCLIWPQQALKDKFSLTGFFYNPNIAPEQEYKKRLTAVQDYAKLTGLEIIFPEYKPEDFFKYIKNNTKKPTRCQMCWQLRLEKTAVYAKENNFDYFSSALLVSPYQDQETLKNIGENLGKKYNIGFFYQDFRDGFRKAHDLAKKQNLYCQKYCGCIYSEKEKQIKSKICM